MRDPSNTCDGRRPREVEHTASMHSTIELGKLKKNFDRSKTPSVVRSFCAFIAFSSTGRKTWSAFCAPASGGALGGFFGTGMTAYTYLSGGPSAAWTRIPFVQPVSPPSSPHTMLRSSFDLRYNSREGRRRHTISRCFHRYEPVEALLDEHANGLGPRV